VALVIPACAADASQGGDAPPGLARTLVQRGLVERHVVLTSIDTREVAGRNITTGDVVRMPLEQVLAILPPLEGDVRVTAPRAHSSSERESNVQVATLTDAQRVVGSIGDSSSWSSPESLPWKSPLLGPMQLNLERVRLLELSRGEGAARSSDPELIRDRVVLRNDDVLEGFVEVMSDDERRLLGLRVESDGRERRVALSRVVRIELSNAPAPIKGQRAWLEDGTTLACSSLRMSAGGQAELTWNDTPVGVASESISAYAPACERVRGLASCRIVSTEPASGRRWTREPVLLGDPAAALGARDVLLSGPMSATWELDAGSVRVGGRVELPAGDRVWGDCEVVIEDAGSDGASAPRRELWRTRLHSAEPSASFIIELPPLTEAPTPRLLRVRVDEGERGPVQDRVVLRRVLVESQ
jgi:hypothetical protein